MGRFVIAALLIAACGEEPIDGTLYVVECRSGATYAAEPMTDDLSVDSTWCIEGDEVGTLECEQRDWWISDSGWIETSCPEVDGIEDQGHLRIVVELL